MRSGQSLMLDICILYDDNLPNGIGSCAAGEGRTLQNYAECFSESGCNVDIYCYSFSSAGPENINLYTLEDDIPKSYDVCLFGGWAQMMDVALDRVKAKAYIYIDYFRSWTYGNKIWQREGLKRSDVFVSCPRSQLVPRFSEDNPYKFIYLPQPIYKKFRDEIGFDRNKWAFTYKFLPGHWQPGWEENCLECVEQLKSYARDLGIEIIDFPKSEPLTAVYDKLSQLQFTLPMKAAASSVEAVVSGVVPLCVFEHDKPTTLKSVFEKYDMFLKYPLEFEVVRSRIEKFRSDRSLYVSFISDARQVLEEYSFDNAWRVFVKEMESMV